MTKTKLTAIITATLTATVLLAGCTQPAPQPTRSSTKTANPTPSADPTQTPVAAPASQQDAYLAANKTIGEFLAVDYQIQHNPSAGASAIEPFASGEALQNEQQTAAQLARNGWSTNGGPGTWSPNASLSTYGEIAVGGKTYPNAIAYMKGCLDISNQTSVTAPGHTPPTTRTATSIPVQFNVQYTPSQRVWMVTYVNNINGKSGAPQC